MEAAHKKKYKEHFPKCVKNILILTGFEKVASLQNITESIIKDIEQHINLNRELLNDIDIDCCFSDAYKNNRPFVFMPGHKAIILAIPAMMESAYEPKSKPEKEKSEEFVENQLIKRLQKTLIKAAQDNNRGNVEASMISSENLYDWTHDNDTSETPTYKCRFLCPYCDKSIRVIYKQYWRSSNVTNHIKNHLAE